MSDSAILGVHEGQFVEYDSSILSPLGNVVNKNGLEGKVVHVVDDGNVVIFIK